MKPEIHQIDDCSYVIRTAMHSFAVQSGDGQMSVQVYDGGDLDDDPVTSVRSAEWDHPFAHRQPGIEITSPSPETVVARFPDCSITAHLDGGRISIAVYGQPWPRPDEDPLETMELEDCPGLRR